MEHNPNYYVDIVYKNQIQNKKLEIENNQIYEYNDKHKTCEVVKQKLKICLENEVNNNKHTDTSACFNLISLIIDKC